MATKEDKVFESVPVQADDVVTRLLPWSIDARRGQRSKARATLPVVATLVEFDAQDHPVICSDGLLGGQRLAARTTVPIKRAQRGSTVVVLCENGDPRLPIIVGVLQNGRQSAVELPGVPLTTIQADDERHVVTAEREIVLRCGEASITLTRAGKVIIKGTYVLSRSSGYNKIKGAAVDIN